MTYQNKHRCGSRIWRKLRRPGRAVYNEVYSAMIKRDLVSPSTKSFSRALISNSDWKIICHNAACLAAWVADEAANRLAA